MIPAIIPIGIAAAGVTKPDAGVIATNPARTPVEKPRDLGRPRRCHSRAIQQSPAAAGATKVVSATAATSFAARAEPALNPNHPNHRIPAPIRVKVPL